MLHKHSCKPIREAFEVLDLVRLILYILWYVTLWYGGDYKIVSASVV